jgi:hypothetical protein
MTSAEQRSKIHKTLPRGISSIHDLLLVAAVEAQIRQFGLLDLQIDHLLLEAILHDETVDGHRSHLAQTVDAVDSLRLGGWVKLRLHDKDRVAGRQVQA